MYSGQQERRDEALSLSRPLQLAPDRIDSFLTEGMGNALKRNQRDRGEAIGSRDEGKGRQQLLQLLSSQQSLAKQRTAINNELNDC